MYRLITHLFKYIYPINEQVVVKPYNLIYNAVNLGLECTYNVTYTTGGTTAADAGTTTTTATAASGATTAAGGSTVSGFYIRSFN